MPRRVKSGWRIIAPPAFLIDTVDLRFDLDEAATKVVARLSMRRNPAAPAGSPLHLDGEALTLVRLARDGSALAPGDYHDGQGRTDHPGHAGLLRAGDRNADLAEGQHRTDRTLRVRRQLFHPVRGSGFPADHLSFRTGRM